MLQLENQSGVLYVRSAHREIVMSMRNGAIDLVQSRGTGDEFRLGRFFLRAGLLTATQIDETLASRTSGEAPLGDLLVAAGKIDEAQLRAALVRQSSELVYEFLRWTHGTFEFRRHEPTRLAVRARLGMPVATIVIEGFRRVDEWRVIEARVGRFDEVLLRDDATIAAVDAGTLTTAEREMLDRVDGQRSIRALVDLSQMSSFDACRVLAELVEARLVRKRAP
jgi:hypothetical protein